ncbi:MAG: alpha/beta hydrolase [Bacteriovoracaceae bacterium]|nr:alpha/beta hydrolase [Bacteriovoracaceae bacterium]
MSIRIEKLEFQFGKLKTFAMLIHPDNEGASPGHLAIFTHGYTASKRDVLPWGVRLAEEGIPSIVFDLPGHYLGNYYEVESFDDFVNDSPRLFEVAYSKLLTHGYKLGPSGKLILGGHSLGALTAFRSSTLECFSNLPKILLGVGFGISSTDGNHIFQSRFYKKTLEVREQLVSPCLKASNLFDWIHDQKEKIQVQAERVHLITGQNDVVVGEKGAEKLKKKLIQKGITSTTLSRPKNLPHHQPEGASVHIYAEFKYLY